MALYLVWYVLCWILSDLWKSQSEDRTKFWYQRIWKPLKPYPENKSIVVSTSVHNCLQCSDQEYTGGWPASPGQSIILQAFNVVKRDNFGIWGFGYSNMALVICWRKMAETSWAPSALTNNAQTKFVIFFLISSNFCQIYEFPIREWALL